LGVGRWSNDPTTEKFTVTKPWRRPITTKGCSATKKEETVQMKEQVRRSKRRRDKSENMVTGTHSNEKGLG
jgi:hypothetical protein